MSATATATTNINTNNDSKDNNNKNNNEDDEYFNAQEMLFSIREYCENNGYKLLDLYDGQTYSNFIKFCRYNSSEPIDN